MSDPTSGDPMTDPRFRMEDGTPASERFGDVYFSRDGGTGQGQHVFLGGNRLPARWVDAGDDGFVIGETGFGTGLNFLVTLRAWRDATRRGASAGLLHYLSVEGYPLIRSQLREALAPWDDLRPLAERLIDAWPARLRAGTHRLWFDDLGACLTLLVGDVVDVLGQLDCGRPVGAWFLDGFSPARNPEMWSDAVFGQVARLSGPETTLATWSVAGSVRRGLAAAGFELATAPGFGRKREMLTGRFAGGPPARHLEPWFEPPAWQRPERVTVVGGGIAGASVARALRRRNVPVTVRDASPQPGSGGSGNPQGVLMLRPSLESSRETRWHEAALAFANRTLPGVRQCGWLQLAPRESVAMRHADVVERNADRFERLTPADASERAGVALSMPGLFSPDASVVTPLDVLGALAGDDRQLDSPVADWPPDDDGGAVVIASAMGAREFAGLDWLPLTPIPGQVTVVPATAMTRPLGVVLDCGTTFTPAGPDGCHVAGSTWRVHEGATTDVTADDHTANLESWRGIFSDLPDASTLTGRASVRATTPDRLPLVGPVIDRSAFVDAFADLRRGTLPTAATIGTWAPAPVRPRAWLLAGLGSHGFSLAPLAAELLVSQMLGEPLPLPRDLVHAVHPARSVVADLKRNRV